MADKPGAAAPATPAPAATPAAGAPAAAAKPGEGQDPNGQRAAAPAAAGVPSDNRIAELNRRMLREREERQQERERLERRVQELEASINTRNADPNQVEQQQQYERFRSEVKKIAAEELTERSRMMVKLTQVVDDVLEGNPIAKRYRQEVMDEMMRMSPELWTKTHVVEDRVDVILGRHIGDVIDSDDERKRAGGKAPEQALMDPAPGAGAPAKGVVLTDEELDFAAEQDLFNKGWTAAEIHAFCEKRKKRQQDAAAKPGK